MAIHVLDKHTAELIAAGEVVERPASVVKELCENAIDAGAGSVFVDIERGGIALIRVGDDGSGVDAEDIPLAFVRHATSKVRTKEDLDAIHTLGFRGEALASIASVADVELLTKTQADEFASLYHVRGGQEMGLEAAARPGGTTIAVRDLFYNTPARMKFLKKDASEGTYVTEVVTRLALSHPEVAFRYTRDAKQVFATPGDGQLQSAVYAVLGKEFAKDLLPVEGEKGQYAVSGLVTPPRANRASRAMQFFFINGRFVKNRTMMAALEQAYRGMTMQGKFPGCVLGLHMPAELVDVNVHPAKTEVRFARESDVFDAVYKAVKTALLAANGNHNVFAIGGADKTEVQTVAATGAGQTVPARATATAPAPASAAQAAAPPVGQRPIAPPADAPRIRAYNEMLGALASEDSAAPYETHPFPKVSERGLDIGAGEPAAEMPAPVQGTPPAPQPAHDAAEQQAMLPGENAATRNALPPLRYVGEVFKTYILTEMGEELCLIDKHAAHERMLYEKLVEGREAPGTQQLLSPLTVTLSAAEKNALLQNGEALATAGIEVEDFGGNAVLVRGIPADVEPDSVEDLVVEVAQRLSVNEKDAGNQKTEWVLHSVACRAAIKAGDHTHPAQLLELASKILSGAIPPFCPHGRPVVLQISRKEIEKQFGRLG